MNEEEIKEMKVYLRRKKYSPYYNQSALSVLEETCFNHLKVSNGAKWYGDFITPIALYLVDRFNEGSFLPSSGLRRIKDSDEEREKAVYQNMESVARNQLIRLSAKGPSSFKIDNVYEFLRAAHSLSKNDSIKLKTNFTLDDSLKALDTIEILGKKRIREFSRFQTGYRRNIDEIREEVKKSKRDYAENPDWARYRVTRINKQVEGIFTRTLGETMVAYLNVDAGLEFIEPYIGKPVVAKNLIFEVMK